MPRLFRIGHMIKFYFMLYNMILQQTRSVSLIQRSFVTRPSSAIYGSWSLWPTYDVGVMLRDSFGREGPQVAVGRRGGEGGVCGRHRGRRDGK